MGSRRNPYALRQITAALYPQRGTSTPLWNLRSSGAATWAWSQALAFQTPGNQVVCVDVSQAKIDLLNAGGVPIYEPGLEALIERNRRKGRLSFTTDLSVALSSGEVVLSPSGPRRMRTAQRI